MNFDYDDQHLRPFPADSLTPDQNAVPYWGSLPELFRSFEMITGYELRFVRTGGSIPDQKQILCSFPVESKMFSEPLHPVFGNNSEIRHHRFGQLLVLKQCSDKSASGSDRLPYETPSIIILPKNEKPDCFSDVKKPFSDIKTNSFDNGSFDDDSFDDNILDSQSLNNRSLNSNLTKMQIISLVQALASVLGDNCQCWTTLQERETEISVLSTLKYTDMNMKSLSKRLRHILKNGMSATGADAVGLYLLDSETKSLKLRASAGLPEERLLEEPRCLNEAFADLEALLGNAVIINESYLAEYWKIPELFPYAVCVPVSTENVILGTLWFFTNSTQEYQQKDLKVLEIIAEQTAFELEQNARLFLLQNENKKIGFNENNSRSVADLKKNPKNPKIFDETVKTSFLSVDSLKPDNSSEKSPTVKPDAEMNDFDNKDLFDNGLDIQKIFRYQSSADEKNMSDSALRQGLNTPNFRLPESESFKNVDHCSDNSIIPLDNHPFGFGFINDLPSEHDSANNNFTGDKKNYSADNFTADINDRINRQNHQFDEFHSFNFDFVEDFDEEFDNEIDCEFDNKNNDEFDSEFDLDSDSNDEDLSNEKLLYVQDVFPETDKFPENSPENNFSSDSVHPSKNDLSDRVQTEDDLLKQIGDVLRQAEHFLNETASDNCFFRKISGSEHLSPSENAKNNTKNDIKDNKNAAADISADISADLTSDTPVHLRKRENEEKSNSVSESQNAIKHSGFTEPTDIVNSANNTNLSNITDSLDFINSINVDATEMSNEEPQKKLESELRDFSDLLRHFLTGRFPDADISFKLIDNSSHS